MARKLPNWIESFMEYTQRSEACYLYRRWVAYSCIAAALQRKVWIKVGLEYKYPNLYVVLVGPPAARKSVAMEPGQRLVASIDVPTAADATTRAAILRDLAKAATWSEIKKVERADGKMGIAMNVEEKDCALTIYSSELASFLGYGEEQLLADLCSWYDCQDNWRNATAGQGITELRKVWLNMIGAITPQNIQSIIPKTAVGGGLTSRMMMVYAPDKGQRVDRMKVIEDTQLYKDLSHDLEQIHLMRGAMHFDKDFAERYNVWYLEEDPKDHILDGRFAGYESRRSDHLLKGCMISCAARSDCFRRWENDRDIPVITVDDFDTTLSLMKATEERMPEVFLGFGMNKNAGALVRMLRTIETKKKMKFSEVAKIFYHDADLDGIDAMIRTLAGMGKIRIDGLGKDAMISWLGGDE